MMGINKHYMNFDKGKIYKIVCLNTGICYIGSTTTQICKRRQQHKADYTGYMNHMTGDGSMAFRNYRASFDILINDNWQIHKIKDFPCKCRAELNAEEQRIIEQYKADGITITNIIPAKSKKKINNKVNNG